MRAPLFPSLVPPTHVCCSGFLSFTLFPSLPTPFSKSWEPPWPVQSLAAVRALGTRNGTRGSRTRDPGPWAGPQEGHGGHRGPAAHPFLSSPCLFPAPSILTAPADRPRWGLSTSRAGGRTAMLGLCFEPRGVLLLPPPALPEPGHVLPAHRAPLSPWQAEAEGPPCQRLGASLNPYSASTSSLSLRQHIWLILPLLFFGACEGRSSYPVTASPPGNVGADPGSGASPLTPSHPGS